MGRFAAYRKWVGILCFLLMPFFSYSNNVQISNVHMDVDGLFYPSETLIMNLSFTLTWDNSWKDAYNHDAVYVFLKYRKILDGEEWHHVLLQDGDHTCTGNVRCEVAPGKIADRNMGVFISRQNPGSGNVSTQVQLKWNIAGNSEKVLSSLDFINGWVTLSASAVEMVYVPRGPYRLGDSYSEKTFWRENVVIPEEDDLIKEGITLLSYPANGTYAADHWNSGTADTTRCWSPRPNENDFAFWQVDFGSDKKCVTRFGVSAARGTVAPKTWFIGGRNTMSSQWDTLYKGNNTNWYYAQNVTYPIEKTIKLSNTKSYRYYAIYLYGITGQIAVKSISMTDGNSTLLNDHSVLVDADVMTIDQQNIFGALDGDNWSSGTLPATYPNGFREFYAMKYELTQEQYIGFLNSLSYKQQEGLLGKSLMNRLKDGTYLFGSGDNPQNRNGIMIERRMEGYPLVFSCNLNPDDPSGQVADGQTLACGYMSIKDMLAYADWVGLRPLSEMEYEKMGRLFYEYREVPEPKEFAWNSVRIDQARNVLAPGMVTEKADGNANYGGVQEGPLRAGVFASTERSGTVEGTGSSYWGVMELCGNLAEIYCNANTAGRNFRAYDFAVNHGDGSLSQTGETNVGTGEWPRSISAFAVRGGSFASPVPDELAISDRRYHKDYFSDISVRDSSVTFRLGRSLDLTPAPQPNTLTLRNGSVAMRGRIAYDTIGHGDDYFVAGDSIFSPGSVYDILWYVSDNGGASWSLMQGYKNKDLALKELPGIYAANGTIRQYCYKRRVITIDDDSEARISISVANPNYKINKKREVLYYGDNSRGITVSAPNPIEVSWKDITRRDQFLLKTITTTPTSSYYRAACADFLGFVYGEDRIIEITTVIAKYYIFKDTVYYNIPPGNYSIDKNYEEITGGNHGIQVSSIYPINVTWRDVKTGNTLPVSSISLTTSRYVATYSHFPTFVNEELRKISVHVESKDACFAFDTVVTYKLSACIKNFGSYRAWGDGTYARSAYEYRYPAGGKYIYSGETGSGVYRIDPDGAGGVGAFDVYCDMDTDGGGWMLAGKFSNNDGKTWCASKNYWTNTSPFGSALNITTFADAKNLSWGYSRINYMMFKTMRVPNKAFVTTTSISNRTLSNYFATTLANFPNTGYGGCYQNLAIRFVNSSYSDFPWINTTGFQNGYISIGKCDGSDTQGVISGYQCSDGEADLGLGSLEDAVFNTNSSQSDVGSGGTGAGDAYNVLLFVK